MKAKSICLKLFICALIAVILMSLIVVPASASSGARINIFKLRYSTSCVADEQAEDILWFAMGSTIAQDDDEEEYFAYQSNAFNYILPFDFISFYGLFNLFVFLFFLILKSSRIICRVMSGPLGGNSPPYFA